MSPTKAKPKSKTGRKTAGKAGASKKSSSKKKPTKIDLKGGDAGTKGTGSAG